MIFHKFDLETNIYTGSEDLEEQPENSTSGSLPETTEFYTIALIEGEIVSVLRPEFTIIDEVITPVGE